MVAKTKQILTPEDIARLKRIGANVKRLRKAAGYVRQQDLADAIARSRSYIGRLESGYASFGSDIERKLTNLFNVDFSEFYNKISTTENDPKIKRVNIMMVDMDEIDKEDIVKYTEKTQLVSELRKKKAG